MTLSGLHCTSSPQTSRNECIRSLVRDTQEACVVQEHGCTLLIATCFVQQMKRPGTLHSPGQHGRCESWNCQKMSVCMCNLCKTLKARAPEVLV